jgi:ankyrin repeat protein
VSSVEDPITIPIAKLLINHNADVNMPDGFGNTPLMVASLKSMPSLVTLLINHGANVNYKSDVLLSAMSWAAYNSHRKIISILINHGVDIEDKYCDNNTALILLCVNWKKMHNRQIAKCAKLLINAGANVNAQNDLGTTPLMICAIKKNTPVAKLLIKAGAKINIKNELSNTALMYACNKQKVSLIKLLLQSGANRFTKNKNGETAKDYLNKQNAHMFDNLIINNNNNNNIERECIFCRTNSINNILMREEYKCAICFEIKNELFVYACGHVNCCGPCWGT